MPRKIEWLLRVPEILDDLSGLDLPVLDRAAIETLFHVRRRRAIDLMASFGAYQVGRTSLLRRDTLIARLEEIAGSESYGYERQRKQRLSDALEEVRRYRRAARVRIAAPPPDPGPGASLPAGVVLADGRMVIAFSSAEELLARLYAVAQAAAQDFESFEAAVERAVQQRPEAHDETQDIDG